MTRWAKVALINKAKIMTYPPLRPIISFNWSKEADLTHFLDAKCEQKQNKKQATRPTKQSKMDFNPNLIPYSKEETATINHFLNKSLQKRKQSTYVNQSHFLKTNNKNNKTRKVIQQK